MNIRPQQQPTVWVPGWAAYLVFSVLSFVALFLVSPFFRSVPMGDSGVFLYAARSLYHGGVPYLHYWDNHPPLIVLIDSLGLYLQGYPGGLWWGVWGLELVSLCLCCALVLRIAGRLTGRWSALVAAAYFLLVVFGVFLSGSNETEEFGMLFQLLAVAIFAGGPAGMGRGFGVGLVSGLAFLTKPNTTAIYGAMMMLALWNLLTKKAERRAWAGFFAASFSGFFVFPTLVFGWLFLRGAVPATVDQLVSFNLLFASFSNPLETVLKTLKAVYLVLCRSGLMPLALIGYASILKSLSGKTAKDRGVNWRSFLAVALPLEAVFAVLAGRGYGFAHYFLIMLPVVVFCAAEGARFFLTRWPRALILFGVLYLAALGNDFRHLKNGLIHLGEQQAAAAGEIAARSAPDDKVVVWGVDPGVAFTADRDCPSRYAFAYPFLAVGYSDRTFPEYAKALASSPPRLVLDTSVENTLIPPLDMVLFKRWASGGFEPTLERRTYGVPKGFGDFQTWFQGHYRLRGSVGGQKWPLYEFTGTGKKP